MIVTEHVFPPIPARQFDWMAYSTEMDHPAAPRGFGHTECAALRDLCAALESLLLQGPPVAPPVECSAPAPTTLR